MTRAHYSLACPKHDEQARTGQPATDCKACDKLHALASLRALLPPGSTVYTILRSVSRSGMSRVITPLMLDPVDGKPMSLVYLVRPVLGYPARVALGHVGLLCQGGGMDMGFHLVHSLSYALHGVGTPQAPFKADPDDFRPGYTLTHRWL